jgi:regulator of sirC expression with transglutaminase-like and TPR domain
VFIRVHSWIKTTVNSKEPFRPEGRSPAQYFSPDAVSHATALAAFAKVIASDEDEIDLGQAALTIAADHYPCLDISAYGRKLDAMAQEAREHIQGARSPESIIAALNAYLFEEQGFRGNAQDYYNPANSFLNEVLDTRRGLPITLSIVYIALAQRLGLPISGVGLPLHFIVRYEAPVAYAFPSSAILIDPFHGGEILTPQTCQERIERILGRPIEFDPAYLQPTPNRLILYRLLNNLKQGYLQREEPERAGRVVEQMLVVAPDSADDIRDRGLLFLQERAFSRAVDWLTRYLACVPDASDAARIQRAIEQAYHLRAQLN